MANSSKYKVLIVDDSALIRSTLDKIVSSFPEFEVIGTAADPYIAVHIMKEIKPDVITLDIQMPKMDGITFLQKLMSQHPIPVVIVSSLTSKDSDIALEAFKKGAIDVLEKPVFISALKHNEWRDHFYESIVAAANSRINNNLLFKRNLQFQNSTDNNHKTKSVTKQVGQSVNSFILIGASAGGTEVINTILSNLEKDTVPVLIVQHMPSQFTPSYAARLNNNSEMSVREAKSGDMLERGLALLAPGDMHMELRNNGFNYFVTLTENEKVNLHRPSVDVLFKSANQFVGPKKMGIILSGMGKDGAEGLLELKKNNAITIAQDQKSCIVFGMPREALRIGAASFAMNIEHIIQTIKDFSKTSL